MLIMPAPHPPFQGGPLTVARNGPNYNNLNEGVSRFRPALQSQKRRSIIHFSRTCRYTGWFAKKTTSFLPPV